MFQWTMNISDTNHTHPFYITDPYTFLVGIMVCHDMTLAVWAPLKI